LASKEQFSILILKKRNIEKTIKAIMFDGKQANWVIWTAKFGAKGVKLGYYNLLNGSSTDVCVPRLIEEGQDYLELGLDENGDPFVVRMVTASQMEVFARENNLAF
jgi:hypothetical protein